MKLAPEEDPWDSFNDYTEDLYHFLKIPVEEVFKGKKEKERVKQILIIVSGMMGIGKTSLVENLIYELRQYWEGNGKGVNVVLTRTSVEALEKYSFEGNPESGWNAKVPIQILIFDDATSIKLSIEDQRRLCGLRHKMMETTKQNEGVLYTILVTHDWFRLDPSFRRTALITCFLSIPPLDLYSKRELKQILTKDGIDFLAEKLGDRIRFDTAKGIGLVVIPFIPALGEDEEKVGKVTWKDRDDVDYIMIKQTKNGKLYWGNKIKKE